ncbi:MAG: hypothetical protein R2792_01395 [Saprospiraceae bacterium]
MQSKKPSQTQTQSRYFSFFFILVFALISSFTAYGQAPRSGAPNIFLNCRWGCSTQYLQTEMQYVNFVRDRADADIFIQQTVLTTGSGGRQVTLVFLGQNQFEGKNDTLVYNLEPAIPFNTIREAMKENLDRGLLPYLLKTSLADRIVITMPELDEEDTVEEQEPLKDPWQLWVYSMNLRFNMSGQEYSESIRLGGGGRARRITDHQKTNFYIDGDYRKNTFRFDDSETEIYENNNYSLGGSQIFSLGQHWGCGFWGSMSQSQYRNLKQSIYAGPALEYSVFPYNEATRRQFTFQYRLGFKHNVYFDETIYFKTMENLGQHSLDAEYNQIAPWGNFNIGMNGGNYLHDWNLYYLNMYTGLSLNLFKGFQLGFSAYYGLLKNQIELSNGGASKDETLLRIRQLQTGFNYNLNFNVSYTFGSIYSNVVNPAFDN